MTSQSSSKSQGAKPRPPSGGTRRSQVKVTVRATEATTELYLIDPFRQLVSRGLGLLKVRVLPGMYTVKARAGNTAHERLMVIRPGDDQHVEEIPQLGFRSAAPLSEATRARGDHASSAKLVSGRIEVDRGAGSEIFVCARSIADAPPGLSFRRVAIVDLTGKEVVDVLSDGVNPLGETIASFTGCNVSVNPGSYRVTYRVADGPELEQSIVAAVGWQTQLFLLQTPATNATRLAIPEISILMSRKGFEPAAESSRWAELARHALAARRPKLAAELSEERADRIADPMTGIYLLHLLVLAEARRPQIEKVLRRVRDLVGHHPDVEIVAQHIGRRRAQTGFEALPLLRHSWNLLLAATVKDTRLVPSESLLAEIAPRSIAVEPWLIWTADPGHRMLHAELEMAMKVPRTKRIGREGPPRQSTASTEPAIPGLAGAEETYSGISVDQTARQRDSRPGGWVISPPPPPQPSPRRRRSVRSKDEEAARLVDTLQLPRSTIESLLRESGRSGKRR